MEYSVLQTPYSSSTLQLTSNLLWLLDRSEGLNRSYVCPRKVRSTKYEMQSAQNTHRKDGTNCGALLVQHEIDVKGIWLVRSLGDSYVCMKLNRGDRDLSRSLRTLDSK